jgi:hypothetical protein
VNTRRIERARERAAEDAATPVYRGASRGALARERRLAIGDPQAPLSRFFEILERHGILADDGRLHEDVHLVSIGDHFDWGGRAQRDRAAADGVALLAWLSAHAPDQVTLVLGNHDLARVGEFAGLDDRTFTVAQAEADALYWGADGQPRACPERQAEAAFTARHPGFATAEVAARDFATFTAAQQHFVASLLRARRFCAGVAAAESLLLCHAGVTADELHALGISAAEQAAAPVVADALNAALDRAVAAWHEGAPLAIPGLHQPGHATSGEARGIFFNRPGHPDHEQGVDAAAASLYSGPPRRRFDPRWLPRGLTQAIGHIRDAKCRKLLGPWAADEEPRDGPLRHLRVRGNEVRYARGLPTDDDRAAATLLFLDGGMNFIPDLADYELLDLDRLAPASRATSAGTPA